LARFVVGDEQADPVAERLRPAAVLRDDRAKMRLDADVDETAVVLPSLARACKILRFGIHHR
jgi:hypothetical protein